MTFDSVRYFKKSVHNGKHYVVIVFIFWSLLLVYVILPCHLLGCARVMRMSRVCAVCFREAKTQNTNHKNPKGRANQVRAEDVAEEDVAGELVDEAHKLKQRVVLLASPPDRLGHRVPQRLVRRPKVHPPRQGLRFEKVQKPPGGDGVGVGDAVAEDIVEGAGVGAEVEQALKVHAGRVRDAREGLRAAGGGAEGAELAHGNAPVLVRLLLYL